MLQTWIGKRKLKSFVPFSCEKGYDWFLDKFCLSTRPASSMSSQPNKSYVGPSLERVWRSTLSPSCSGMCASSSSSSGLRPCMGKTTADPAVFRVMSFNILAQSLVDDKYSQHDPSVMDWNNRKNNICEEITQNSPDVVALQEVDHWHFECLLNKFRGIGYDGIYKKKTRNKDDGVAILWKTCRFTYRDFMDVEFFLGDGRLMDRDQVALILVLRDNLTSIPEGRSRQPPRSDYLVVANTHLLFNTKRGDVKLGQLCMLLDGLQKTVSKLEGQYHNAESTSSRSNETASIGCVLCGDFNMTPQSALYKWMDSGSIDFSKFAFNQLSGQHLMVDGGYSVDCCAREGRGSTRAMEGGNYWCYGNRPDQQWLSRIASEIDLSLFRSDHTETVTSISSNMCVNATHMSSSIPSPAGPSYNRIRVLTPPVCDYRNFTVSTSYEHQSSAGATYLLHLPFFLKSAYSANITSAPSVRTGDGTTNRDGRTLQHMAQQTSTTIRPSSSSIKPDEDMQGMRDSGSDVSKSARECRYCHKSITCVRADRGKDSSGGAVVSSSASFQDQICSCSIGVRDMRVQSEPAYTAYHGWQKGCIDYIWYTSKDLQVVGLYELPRVRDTQVTGSIPNPSWTSSDHFSLVADFLRTVY
eukprot:GHVQ01004479.1.p1 GENE.GHVQ01004479.1~~GHVQ01004479.1.p1  ORF type:complete len:639 (+),score=84.49 GHVQ01004479.1:657-2573(+)